ncbi:uncharacterized protein FOBCDRAFT_281491 [Fusarium oxysporum Fo47]|uniref:uncharacterized protein n=1 Tax=Fusarium oxysporum Fo47 TaxID=660027 RepID=UPI002869D619|nr:uncharacterized protein FOBCDRAFT_281491 [Fusarium oxysporum Fo47]QKD61851.2 hypothetical protein FOBCDRAFT_281491 [Fusarium oxysporum Fo47]
MQLSTVLLNALLAFSGVAALLKGEPAASAKLIDINSVGEVSEIPESEIAPAGRKTVFDEHASPNPERLSSTNPRSVVFSTKLLNGTLALKGASHVALVWSYGRWLSESYDHGPQPSTYSFEHSNLRSLMGDVWNNCKPGTFTTGDLKQVLALVLRNCDPARSGWAYVSLDHVLVAIVHDRTIPPPQPHLTC